MSRATIISDASLCGTTGAAGWAGWVKSDTDTRSRMWSGKIKITPRDSSEAELFAIANTLHMACTTKSVTNGSEVLLQSDSCIALGRILREIPSAILANHLDSAPVNAPRKPKPYTDNTKLALASIKALVDTYGITLKIRHVRGHKEGDGRQWVNRQCDMAARKAMKLARKEAAA